ncbi:MAG: lytic transglycosylase domain-containing protein [Acidobacteria bacterium]|nr:lytic transglycosylase domain-containing protein [Acidobacteriota bacterium]
MLRSSKRWICRGWAVLAVVATVCPLARAMEHVVLKNGFEMDCSRREIVGDKVRLYLAQTSATGEGNYLEVASDAVARVEGIPDPPVPQGLKPLSFNAVDGAAKATLLPKGKFSISDSSLSKAEMHTMLSHAGDAHNIDEDLLASVVRAESGGQVRAVSRVGAQGLMQLMPKTATELGVTDSFKPEENVAGGSAYLDQLLTRYHDNVALALAAYNAGPAAVDRYRGVPPYRETQVYVARVIREFNRRKKMARAGAQVAESR